jgi:flagellar motor switch protein FliG
MKVTLNVPDEDLAFFIELLSYLKFEVAVEIHEPLPDAVQEEIERRFKNADPVRQAIWDVIKKRTGEDAGL